MGGGLDITAGLVSGRRQRARRCFCRCHRFFIDRAIGVETDDQQAAHDVQDQRIGVLLGRSSRAAMVENAIDERGRMVLDQAVQQAAVVAGRYSRRGCSWVRGNGSSWRPMERVLRRSRRRAGDEVQLSTVGGHKAGTSVKKAKYGLAPGQSPRSRPRRPAMLKMLSRPAGNCQLRPPGRRGAEEVQIIGAACARIPMPRSR